MFAAIFILFNFARCKPKERIEYSIYIPNLIYMKKPYPQHEEQMAGSVAEPTVTYGIPTAVAEVWMSIQGLSAANKRWIADRIYIETKEEEQEETHSRVLSLFDQSCQELRLNREGQLDDKPVEELLNEL